MKETPYFGGNINGDVSPNFHYRHRELYWKASYAADRMQDAYDRGRRDALGINPNSVYALKEQNQQSLGVQVERITTSSEETTIQPCTRSQS